VKPFTAFSAYLSKFKGDHMPVPHRAVGKGIAMTCLGSVLALGALLALGQFSAQPWIMASLGASCLLVFGFPDGFFAQPRNVVGGHVVSALCGMAALSLFGAHDWAMLLAIASAIALTMWLRIPHPPSCANPIIIFMTEPSWSFVLFPALAGSALLVLMSLAYNNATRVGRYPKYW
jgi:CBS-domain-containing membrane protein